MNIIRELRKKKGIQQKELAIEIGVSNATVSDWEHQRKNPRGENLKKLADYFGVDEQFILGYGMENPTQFIPENPKIRGISETDQIVNYLLEKLTDNQPKTPEARILAKGVDMLPEEQRKMALNVFRTIFAQHPYFKEVSEEDET